ncbi:M81 family metallopeptidase [Mesorhizobium australicum]|uniref:M81 family metallopeptidase n=1 Tax=Mesorhizobium australicum TaxID=536018 RepID=UPI0012EB2F56
MTERRILVGRAFMFAQFHSADYLACRFEIRRGKDVIAHARQSGTTFGGIVNRVEELGYKAIPTVSAVAPPGGLVDYDF